MAKYLFYILFLFAFTNTIAQTPDSGQFIIHRHLKVIGKETYQLDRTANGNQAYAIDCFYSDRGSDVPLKATMLLSSSGEPLKMISKGLTSRHSQINDTVTISQDGLLIKKDSATQLHRYDANMFPVDGAAPATIQWLLVNWWIKHGRPATINGLFGKIEMRLLGADTIRIAGTDRILTAIGIKNVIWGWEFLWIDQAGNLAALATINAEGDKFEFIRPEYEDQLLFFAQQSATYGTRQYAVTTTENHPSAIIHGVLVDMEKGTELRDAAIVMVNGKISWTGPTSKAVIPAGATVTDAKGKRMLPGLWDMHAHLKQVEWGPAYIAAGITTARDMANEFVFINTMKESIDAGKGVGPTILRAGIIDGPGPLGNGIMIATTKEEGIALVKKYKEAGFEQIKLYGQLKPDVIQAVCDAAHRVGLTVTGHIPKSITTLQGIDMGINMIAHAPYIMNAFVTDSNFRVDFKLPANQQALQKLLDKKVVLDPTLTIFELVYRSFDQPLTSIEPAFKTLPAKIQTDFTNMGLPPAEASKKRAIQKGYQQLVFQLYKAGVPIVAGTDMMIPGYTLYRELEAYVAAGLTPLQALQCATITPARVMGLLSKTGSLVKGKDADIILVDGNPLTNISDIRKVSLVFKGGNLYNSAELHHTIDF
jgi:imidazolonepropionase-like amidohydrolase